MSCVLVASVFPLPASTFLQHTHTHTHTYICIYKGAHPRTLAHPFKLIPHTRCCEPTSQSA
ncbi:hypothetical protein HanPSC8_Chr03g0098041 [Helianthus annuus]|nr:hypothetical protein HanPSC8_Chr03g0098041 [Helianthus annuus]